MTFVSGTHVVNMTTALGEVEAPGVPCGAEPHAAAASQAATMAIARTRDMSDILTRQRPAVYDAAI